MKIIENLIKKTIVKMIKEIDFKALLQDLISKHKEEILAALKDLIKEAVKKLSEDVELS